MMPNSNPRHVLIIEDHAPTREALVDALNTQSGLVAVGAATAAEALAQVDRMKISVALVDLRLGSESGVDVIRILVSKRVPCLALSVVDEATEVLGALRAGASGYLLKSDPLERVVLAIDEILTGKVPLSSGVAGHLIDAIQPDESPVSLTPREQQLLVALARGLTYAACAEHLGVRVGTIQTYVKTLYTKLEVSTKTEACAWAIRYGLVR